MLKHNTYLEKSAARLCDIQPNHKVLEVGFGPGVGLQAAHSHIQGNTDKVVHIIPVCLSVAI